MGTYEAKLHSESINKWTGEIEDRFDIEAFGDTPTERMENALDQLDALVGSSVSHEKLRSFVRKTVLTWYRVGARRGAAEMLKDLMWYGVLPDDIDDLEAQLEEPLSNDDSLVWNTLLRYKKHNDEDGKTRATVKVKYIKYP